MTRTTTETMLLEALQPLVAIIPDICDALDLDMEVTSIRLLVEGGQRDGEVLAERTLAQMLDNARRAIATAKGEDRT